EPDRSRRRGAPERTALLRRVQRHGIRRPPHGWHGGGRKAALEDGGVRNARRGRTAQRHESAAPCERGLGGARLARCDGAGSELWGDTPFEARLVPAALPVIVDPETAPLGAPRRG